MEQVHILFLFLLALVVLVWWYLDHRAAMFLTNPKRSMLLRMHSNNIELGSVEESKRFHSPEEAEKEALRLWRKEPEKRCLVQQQGATWVLYIGTNLVAHLKIENQANQKYDKYASFYYLYQNAPNVIEEPAKAKAKVVITESFQPEVTPEVPNRKPQIYYSIPHNMIRMFVEGAKASRHGSLQEARRVYEQHSNISTTVLLQNTAKNDRAWYVVLLPGSCSLQPNGTLALIEPRPV